MIIALIYVVTFILAFIVVRVVSRFLKSRADFTSLKTVTFGDESAVTPDRAATVISIVGIFLIWGAFTGSKLTPFHMPGPFIGNTSFSYTAENAAGDEAGVALVDKEKQQSDHKHDEDHHADAPDDQLDHAERRCLVDAPHRGHPSKRKSRRGRLMPPAPLSAQPSNHTSWNWW